MEDFVTFELAKKLKEKGFNNPCIYAYCNKGGWNKYTQKREPITQILRTDGNPFGSYYCGKNWNKDYSPNKNKIQCSAPTISQVLKWLREEKKLHIELWTVGKKPIKWCHTITTLNHVGEKQGWSSEERGDSYEAAALAGIEYVLDNLI